MRNSMTYLSSISDNCHRKFRENTQGTTGVRTFNFHSIDLNAYLYREKRTLAKMAAVLGNGTAGAAWTTEAEALLPVLQAYFYKPDPSVRCAFSNRNVHSSEHVWDPMASLSEVHSSYWFTL
jgi:hypothetical protein